MNIWWDSFACPQLEFLEHLFPNSSLQWTWTDWAKLEETVGFRHVNRHVTSTMITWIGKVVAQTFRELLVHLEMWSGKKWGYGSTLLNPEPCLFLKECIIIKTLFVWTSYAVCASFGHSMDTSHRYGSKMFVSFCFERCPWNWVPNWPRAISACSKLENMWEYDGCLKVLNWASTKIWILHTGWICGETKNDTYILLC